MNPIIYSTIAAGIIGFFSMWLYRNEKMFLKTIGVAAIGLLIGYLLGNVIEDKKFQDFYNVSAVIENADTSIDQATFDYGFIMEFDSIINQENQMSYPIKSIDLYSSSAQKVVISNSRDQPFIEDSS